VEVAEAGTARGQTGGSGPERLRATAGRGDDDGDVGERVEQRDLGRQGAPVELDVTDLDYTGRAPASFGRILRRRRRRLEGGRRRS
jgi:hypothetical protein